MKNHPGGSHNNHAHPDGKMSPRHNQPSRMVERATTLSSYAVKIHNRSMTSIQRQVDKHVSNAKRRLRDKEVVNEEY